MTQQTLTGVLTQQDVEWTKPNFPQITDAEGTIDQKFNAMLSGLSTAQRRLRARDPAMSRLYESVRKGVSGPETEAYQ